jgi:hypothetical protein
MVTEPTDSDEAADVVAPAAAEWEKLVELLVSAYRPSQLDPALNQALIDNALDDPLRLPTSEELAESERFRRALAGDGEHPDLALAEALLHSHGSVQAPIDVERVNSNALQQSLGQLPELRRRRRPNVVFVTFGVATLMTAAAAAVLLLIAPFQHQSGSSAEQVALARQAPTLTRSRSSESLFSSKFERQRTTERVDAIASARAREFRANRFEKWGIAP